MGRLKLIVCFIFLMISQDLFAINPEKSYKYAPSDYGLSNEQISIPSTDGAEIACWHIPVKHKSRAKASVIVANSDAGNMAYWLNLAFYLNFLSYDVWLFDYRGFGESSDFDINREQLFYPEFIDDLATVVTEAERYSRKPIVFMGYSMGTIVINEYLNRVKDKRIKAAVCDGFVGDPYSYVLRLKAQGKDVFLPEHYEYPGAFTGIPSLYFSAKQDKFCSKEEIPQEATEIKEFDCGHIMGLSSFKEEYISSLDSFLKNNLK